jgi:hypothetical protein
MIKSGIYTSPMDRACLRVLAEWCGIEEEINCWRTLDDC